MTGTAVASAELYDPTTGTWTMTGSANGVPAFGGFAGLLSPGEVLVTNGHGGYAQLYNPSTSTWTNDNSGHTGGNQGQAVTLLGTGMLLTCGGTQGVYPRKITAISSCDLFDPSTSNLVSTGSMALGSHHSWGVAVIPQKRGSGVDSVMHLAAGRSADEIVRCGTH